MTSDEFARDYRMVRRVALDGVTTYEARRASGADAVLVHWLGSGGAESSTRLVTRLLQLPLPERDELLEIEDVDGSTVVVTTVLPGFVSLERWLDTLEARAASPPAPAGPPAAAAPAIVPDADDPLGPPPPDDHEFTSMFMLGGPQQSVGAPDGFRGAPPAGEVMRPVDPADEQDDFTAQFGLKGWATAMPTPEVARPPEGWNGLGRPHDPPPGSSDGNAGGLLRGAGEPFPATAPGDLPRWAESLDPDEAPRQPPRSDSGPTWPARSVPGDAMDVVRMRPDALRPEDVAPVGHAEPDPPDRTPWSEYARVTGGRRASRAVAAAAAPQPVVPPISPATALGAARPRRRLLPILVIVWSAFLVACALVIYVAMNARRAAPDAAAADPAPGGRAARP
jgi:hypothetical protein